MSVLFAFCPQLQEPMAKGWFLKRNKKMRKNSGFSHECRKVSIASYFLLFCLLRLCSNGTKLCLLVTGILSVWFFCTIPSFRTLCSTEMSVFVFVGLSKDSQVKNQTITLCFPRCVIFPPRWSPHSYGLFLLYHRDCFLYISTCFSYAQQRPNTCSKWHVPYVI